MASNHKIITSGAITVYYSCVDFHFGEAQQAIYDAHKKRAKDTKLIEVSICFMRSVTEKEYNINVN